MNETFEQQVIRIWMSAEARDYDMKVDPVNFARALAAEWFRTPEGWHCVGRNSKCISMNDPTPTTDSVTPLYRKPEGL